MGVQDEYLRVPSCAGGLYHEPDSTVELLLTYGLLIYLKDTTLELCFFFQTLYAVLSVHVQYDMTPTDWWIKVGNFVSDFGG